MKKNYKVILGGMFVIILAYWPHLQNGMYMGSDDYFHYYRIYGLAQTLANGIFPAKIHSTACFGYGYGVGFFYSNALLYIPALLINIFNIPLIVSYKIFILILYVAMFGTMYYSTKKLTKNQEAAFYTASILLFTNKIIENIYYNMALGQVAAFVFIPLAIVGMYIFLKEDESTSMLMVGFIGLVLTHTISLFYTFLICLFMCIIYIKTFDSKIKILKLLYAVVSVIGVTAIYWLPMLEQLKAQILKVKAPWAIAEQNVHTLFEAINDRVGLGWLVVLIGLLCIGGIIYILKREKNLLNREGELLFLGLACFIFFVSLHYPFWHFMNSVIGIKLIQFPHRLYVPVTFLLLFAGAKLYSILEIEKQIKRIIMLGLLVLGVYFFHEEYYEHFTDTTYGNVNQVLNMEVAGVGSGAEWLPINANSDMMIAPNIAKDNEGNKIRGEKIDGYTKYIFEADLGKEYYEVPYVWYKGYTAVDSKGNTYNMGQNYENGMLKVIMPEDGVGREEITVYYEGTRYQKIAYLGTIIGIGMIGIYILFNKKYVRTRKLKV